MSAADGARPVTVAEARALFAPFVKESCIALAVSGGPDSTALLWLAARWRAQRKSGPDILALTVDHGLRKESAREAGAVKALARRLGVAHRTLRWRGVKPGTRLQEAARQARYALLAQAAKKAGARHLVTAHTLDDQAETVLLRFLRGSGPAGLKAMAQLSPCPGAREIVLARPLLDIPKARLIATLDRAGTGFAEDPSNSDPRHTRARLRALMPELEREGLSARRLALLACRLQRMDAALRAAVAEAARTVSRTPWGEGRRIVFDRAQFFRLPEEVALRLLGRAIEHVGDPGGEGGPAALGKLESLFAALSAPGARLRRTLAGALVTAGGTDLVVECAPPRRRAQGNTKSSSATRISALTTRKTVPTARPGSG